MDSKLDLLRRLLDAYELLLNSDGASAPIDGQEAFTAGGWVGHRLQGLMQETEAVLQRAGYRLVVLQDGRVVRAVVHLLGGAAMVGDATAYVNFGGRTVWVKPGESCEFVEV